jgi:hypothetical protein
MKIEHGRIFIFIFFKKASVVMVLFYIFYGDVLPLHETLGNGWVVVHGPRIQFFNSL